MIHHPRSIHEKSLQVSSCVESTACNTGSEPVRGLSGHAAAHPPRRPDRLGTHTSDIAAHRPPLTLDTLHWRHEVHVGVHGNGSTYRPSPTLPQVRHSSRFSCRSRTAIRHHPDRNPTFDAHTQPHSLHQLTLRRRRLPTCRPATRSSARTRSTRRRTPQSRPTSGTLRASQGG